VSGVGILSASRLFHVDQRGWYKYKIDRQPANERKGPRRKGGSLGCIERKKKTKKQEGLFLLRRSGGSDSGFGSLLGAHDLSVTIRAKKKENDRSTPMAQNKASVQQQTLFFCHPTRTESKNTRQLRSGRVGIAYFSARLLCETPSVFLLLFICASFFCALARSMSRWLPPEVFISIPRDKRVRRGGNEAFSYIL